MPIRYINPEQTFDVMVQGTKCTVKQIYPQGDFFKMEKCRLNFVHTGNQKDMEDLVVLLLKYVVNIDNLPEGWDIKKGLDLMTASDLMDLSIAMTNKSTFTEEEEKN